MGHIIRLHDDPHQQTQALLPWYCNHTLEPAEAAAVEAHLAECAECRADLESNRALGSIVTGISMDVERGWPAMRERIEQAPPRRAAPSLPPLPFLRRRITVGAAVAAQIAAAASIVVAILLVPAPSAEPVYHALGSARAASSANMVILFTPDTEEREMRAALVRTKARLVDGPTSGGAYLVRVAEDERPAALAQLRATSGVVLAEPIDGSGP